MTPALLLLATLSGQSVTGATDGAPTSPRFTATARLEIAPAVPAPGTRFGLTGQLETPTSGTVAGRAGNPRFKVSGALAKLDQATCSTALFSDGFEGP